MIGNRWETSLKINNFPIIDDGISIYSKKSFRQNTKNYISINSCFNTD